MDDEFNSVKNTFDEFKKQEEFKILNPDKRGIVVSKVTDEVFEDRNMYEAVMTGQAKVPRKVDKTANPNKNTKLFDMFTSLERRLRILEDMPDKVPSTVIHKHYKEKKLKNKTAQGIAGKLNINLNGPKDEKGNLIVNANPVNNLLLNQNNNINQNYNINQNNYINNNETNNSIN